MEREIADVLPDSPVGTELRGAERAQARAGSTVCFELQCLGCGNWVFTLTIKWYPGRGEGRRPVSPVSVEHSSIPPCWLDTVNLSVSWVLHGQNPTGK